MKLEWGKKVSCPACAMVFYDMQKSNLVCPHCGNKFGEADLKFKNIGPSNVEELDIETKFSGIDFVDDSMDFVDESDSLEVSEELDDIRVIEDEDQ